MNKTMINVLLFLTLVMGTMAILTFDVWADDSSESIPDGYNSRNYVLQWREMTTGTKTDDNVSYDYQNINDYYCDFTIYYPGDSECAIEIGSSKDFFIALTYNDSTDTVYELPLSMCKTFSFDNVYKLKATGNYKDDSYPGDIIIYIKLNSGIITSLYRDGKGVYEQTEKSCNLSSFSRLGKSIVNMSCNYPFYVIEGNYIYVYSGIYDSGHMVQRMNFISSDRHTLLSNIVSAIRYVKKRIDTNVSGVFPEPKLNKVNKISDITLHCFYDYPTQGRIPNFLYVYPKIFVKVKGNDEWVEFQNLDTSQSKNAIGYDIFGLKHDSTNKSIWGNLSLYALYERMGYTAKQINAGDFVPPKIEGIIWGVQYGYALTQNILDESSIRKSKIVFSRYVFEDNIVDTPDVGIGDLGDLPNISGSNSSIEVGSGSNIGSGGGHHVPAPSDSADYSDVGSFFKSLNFDFSSIGKALSGSFSLVTGFASMIGTIFQKFFGDAVGIIALLAIGICIVLRVLGR